MVQETTELVAQQTSKDSSRFVTNLITQHWDIRRTAPQLSLLGPPLDIAIGIDEHQMHTMKVIATSHNLTKY